MERVDQAGRRVRGGDHQAARTGRGSRREPAGHDSVTSPGPGIQAEADRPLGFDQVADLSGNRVTRAQVSAASSALCRDGQLDRIRAGVYQWSAGERATARRIPAARPPASAQPPQAPSAAAPVGPAAASGLFSQLFPADVQMTSEFLADLEQWARLTSKLTTESGRSAQ